MSRTALLFGSTGLVGGHCLEILLRDDSYTRVVAFTRRSLNVSHPKLAVEIVDFDRPEDYASLVTGDDLFCCLGTTIGVAGSQEAFARVDFTYPQQIASAASANGVARFLLVSSLGADSKSSIFYSRVKGELEDAVRRLPFQGIRIFRPSLLLGERKEVRMGEKIAGALSAVIAPVLLGALRKYRPIKARDVAAAMVTVAKGEGTGIAVYQSDTIARIASLGQG